MKSIKPLRPTLREKKRYLAYQVLAESPVSPIDVKQSVQNTLQVFMGELSYGAAGIQVIDTAHQNGIIRFHPSYQDEVKAGLAMIQYINNKKAAVQSTIVSGMIHKAQAKLGNQRRN